MSSQVIRSSIGGETLRPDSRVNRSTAASTATGQSQRDSRRMSEDAKVPSKKTTIYPQPKPPSRKQLLFCPGLLIARPMKKSRFKNQFKNYYLEEQYRISVFKCELFRLRSAITFVLMCAILFGQILCFKMQTITTLRLLTVGLFLAESCMLLLTFHPDVLNRTSVVAFATVNSILVMMFPWAILLLFKPYMGTYISSDMADTHYVGVMFIVGLVHLFVISGLPGVVCLLIGIVCSTGQLLLMSHIMGQPNEDIATDDAVCQAVLYVILNVLLWYLCDYVNARKRSLFLREGNQLLSLRQLEKEKTKFENLLKTTMPKSLALDVIRNDDQNKQENRTCNHVAERIRVQDKVTIIFADIVGFTQMSSGKSAAQLVELLSDLFGRFDDLCEFTGCEKMATLGDCYYCVCGCPDELADHAARAIDMGLFMVDAIARFDQDRGESVEMRVGIHSGKVMCGFVGNTRYKYDVLSADVFKANDMESCGEAGKVHVSQETCEYLSATDKSRFEFEENKDMETRKGTHIEDLTTFFVTRKGDAEDESYIYQSAVRSGSQSSGLTRHSSFMANAQGIDVTLYPPVNDQEPTDFPAVPPNIPMMKQDRFLINSMNQKRLFIDWFNIDPMGWVFRFRESDNESKYHNFFQHRISVDTDDNQTGDSFVLQMKLTGSQSLLLSSRTTSTIEHSLTFVITIAIFVCSILMYDDLDVLVFWVVAGPFLALLIFVAVMDVVPLANHNQPVAVAYIRKFFTSYYPYQIFCVLFMCVPCCLACFVPLVSSLAQWGHIQMYLVVMGFVAFLNYPRVCAWMRCLFALLIMITYCVILLTECEFAEHVRFPIETLIGIFLLILALLLLVTIEFELLARQDFYSHIHEDAKKKNLERARERANLELRNVLPEFVITFIDENLSSNYSNSRKNCAILFFYVDFFEHYTEVLKSGLEWVELLNELICDFDNLLALPKYSCIFKIKTISSTYMAASNLAPGYKLMNWKSQAVKLMEVADLMRRRLASFSHSVLQFHKPGPEEPPARFSYKIGFNIGDVTTGVIGITKPFFDIWGDSVNVASRMYSTADVNMCQVTEEARKFLQVYSKWGRRCFKFRGEIPVKGKGMMKTFELNLDAIHDHKKKKASQQNPAASSFTRPITRKGFASRFYRGGSHSGFGARKTRAASRRANRGRDRSTTPKARSTKSKSTRKTKTA